MEFIKDLYKKIINDSSGQDKTKKNIQNLAIFIMIGIALLLVSGFLTGNNKKAINTNETLNKKIVNNEYLDEYDVMLENKIKNILSQISGVGKVSVAITYSSGKEIVPMQDIKQNELKTNENDREGGVRSTIQVDTDNKTVINQEAETKPVVLKELPPEVKGVIVVADGAKNQSIKIDISKAVSTALGISLSKIEVFPRNSNVID